MLLFRIFGIMACSVAFGESFLNFVHGRFEVMNWNA